MKDIIKTASVSGMLTGLVLVAGCGESALGPEPVPDTTVGGSVTGLEGTLGLTNNSDSIRLSGDGDFTFHDQDDGATYHVTVSHQPVGQTCAVTNASGTINTANINNVAVSCIDSGPPKPTPESKSLNDTGNTLCGDHSFDGSKIAQNNLDCASIGVTTSATGIDSDGDPVPAGQDAVYGRDVSHNDNSDGHAGFSFTKLDGNGQALPATATHWDCVQDNVTGLIWEVKTDDGGLRDKDWTYTWYNSSGENTGGDHGIGDTGVGITTGLERFPYHQVGPVTSLIGTLGWVQTLFTGSDNCADNSRCDTEKYVEDVNAAGLCGTGSDWRLPTVAELHGIALMGRVAPAIDSDYFPNTVVLDLPENSFIYERGGYWSATPSPVLPPIFLLDNYWQFTELKDAALLIEFRSGGMLPSEKSRHIYVRLVRASD